MYEQFRQELGTFIPWLVPWLEKMERRSRSMMSAVASRRWSRTVIDGSMKLGQTRERMVGALLRMTWRHCLGWA